MLIRIQLSRNLVLTGKQLRFQVDKSLALFQEVAPDVQSLHNRLEPAQLVDSTTDWEALYAQNKKWGRWLGRIRTLMISQPTPFNPMYYQGASL